MNERIRELAEQAWYYQVRIFNEPDGTRTYSEKEKVFDKEKFAELIVKECGVALSPMLRDMVSCGQAYDLIKQHFGVE
jgi:hypothetical protein